jgi:hypothetical protein
MRNNSQVDSPRYTIIYLSSFNGNFFVLVVLARQICKDVGLCKALYFLRLLYRMYINLFPCRDF